MDWHRPLLAIFCCGWLACSGADHPPGEITGTARPAPAPLGSAERILFGDLHVHTTYSVDAFVFSLPVFAGDGQHPPADACDFARHCSALDFFSINDHAEGLTPERWQATKESIRACNARAGDPANPDLVAFLGWEWTQVGATAEDHFGHKNVMFPGQADDEVPARPITALPDSDIDRAPPTWLLRGAQYLTPSVYADFVWLIEQLARLPNCPRGVDTRALPTDCRENATTPAELFEKLEQWGFESLVIPHGVAWGIHAPPGSSWDLQTGPQHDPERQRLLEVYSGHGEGEVYRSALDVPVGACAEPTPHFLPCCWRAGEIMRERCGDLPAEVCEARVEEARRRTLEAGVAPHRVFPDTTVEDWLDCDQCRDCFKPVLTPRVRESAQYALTVSDEGSRFRFGFIGSSDTHEARAGNGYKQVARLRTTDARGIQSERVRDVGRWLRRPDDPRTPQVVAHNTRSFGALLDVERGASFMYPGGLVAVHTRGRSREQIWDALVRREVYGTSGPRIQLWFDLVNAPEGPLPMGAETALGIDPRFEVRAVGSRIQQPGCPDASEAGLSADRLERLCLGECHHPGESRRAIRAIEVVRVRPRVGTETAADSIDDPWRRFECAPDPEGCVVRFEDPEFVSSGRDAVYYVRVLQEETPAINARGFRTEFDAEGRAVRISPCYGDPRTPPDDDCLSPVSERAWSSPIFVDQARGR